MFNKRNIKKITAFLVLILSILPSISAYNGWSRSLDLGFGSFSLSEIFENEMIFFALIFIVFFAITFFALGKTMKENKGAAVVISIVVSLFIAFAVSQRTRYYGYLGEAIGNWFLLIAGIIGIIIFIKFVTGFIGGFGLFLSLFGIWYLLSKINAEDIFPDYILNSPFFSIYEFLSGSLFITLLIIAVILVFIIAYAGDGNKAVKNWLWKKKEQEEIVIRKK